MPQSATPVHVQLVDVMQALAGSHPGFRPAHAKGIVCSGTFRAGQQARTLSRAVHFQGQPVATVLRFSNASGNPEVHDGQPGERALSVKFQLPDGKSTDILANSVEGFPVRTPEEFLALLRTQLPDPATGKPVPDALQRFVAGHPAMAAYIGRLMPKAVPASYVQATYHAEHAFLFTAADGTRRHGRYRWTPEAGEAYLSPDDAAKRSPNFLRDELESRLRRGPAAFRLAVQLAADGDPTDDATALWPADRPLVELGRLEVAAISPTGATDERRLIFDPSNRTDGIDLSADPILQVRSAAYSVSYARRGGSA